MLSSILQLLPSATRCCKLSASLLLTLPASSACQLGPPAHHPAIEDVSDSESSPSLYVQSTTMGCIGVGGWRGRVGDDGRWAASL